MTADIACRTCFFWHPKPDQRFGECRRDAPVTQHGSAHGYAAWPLTLPLDWCGEHAPPVPGPVPRAGPPAPDWHG